MNFTNTKRFETLSGNIALIGSIMAVSTFGIILNAIVWSIIMNSKRLGQPIHSLIANLAIIDIIYCSSSVFKCSLTIAMLSNPLSFQHLSNITISLLCGINNFVSAISMSNSMMTLAFIGIEKYRGIIYPLSLPFGKQKMMLIIVGIWSYSVICALLFTFVTVYDHHTIMDCSGIFSHTYSEFNVILSTIFAIFTSLLPLLVIIICYTCIIAELFRTKLPIDDSPYKKQLMKKIKKRNSNIILLLIMTILTAGGSVPYIISFVWISFYKVRYPNFKTISKEFCIFFQIAAIFMFLPCLFNPILYNFAISSLKNEFKRTIVKLKLKLHHSIIQRQKELAVY